MPHPFILPDTFVKSLQTLRKDYELSKGEVLPKQTTPPGFFGQIACYLGTTNTDARNKQVCFIEILQRIAFQSIPREGDHFQLTTPETTLDYFKALHILLSAVFYIQFELAAEYKLSIRSPVAATLTKLLDKALKLDEGNVMDEDTRAHALIIASEFIADIASHPLGNHPLKTALSQANLSAMWEAFAVYIDTERKKLDIKYSAATILSPVFGTLFSLPGYAVGYVVGEVASSSSPMFPVRCAISAAIAPVIYTFSGGGQNVLLGITNLVAPVYAGILLTTMSAIGFAWLLGNAMQIVGRGVGWGIGATLDSSWALTCYSLALLFNQDKGPVPPISGINLVNGHQYYFGLNLTTLMQANACIKVADGSAVEPLIQAIELTQEGIQITNATGAIQIIPFNAQALPEGQQRHALEQLKAQLEGNLFAFEEMEDGFVHVTSAAEAPVRIGQGI